MGKVYYFNVFEFLGCATILDEMKLLSTETDGNWYQVKN